MALLAEYSEAAGATDQLASERLRPVQMGLFGEVGSVLATHKKRVREGESYSGFRDALEEEFGDSLWYFVALCRRVGVDVGSLESPEVSSVEGSDDALVALGSAAAALLECRSAQGETARALESFWQSYHASLQACGLGLPQVVETNLQKIRGRFAEPNYDALPTFDRQFPEGERLPARFSVHVRELEEGRSGLWWEGEALGDPLDDNIEDEDGYRFHDVFHLAFAAILHWSPVCRALMGRKRKSVASVDRTQDGGRAIAVEEGLSVWLFSYAKEMAFFEGQESLSFDVLKTVSQFVRGYEVEQCPLRLWERAILEGYSVFRSLRARGSGVVVGDRLRRGVEFRSS